MANFFKIIKIKYLILFMSSYLISCFAFLEKNYANKEIKETRVYSKWSTSLSDNSMFKTSKSLRSRVDFWKKIYSEISENEGLFHHPHNPSLIYGKVSWDNIAKNSVLNSRQKKIEINKIINQEKLALQKKWKLKKSNQIRLQSGLKERMQSALFISGQYLPMMEKVFKNKNLPIELSRLVFVESSFNIYAQSKVGASGLWQIMPSVARAEGYLNQYYDNRNHPYLATELASDILAFNYKELKSWPLAITAYNHGLYGLKKMVKLNNSSRISKLIKAKNNTNTWGFASENFYSCFLAVLEVEKEASDIFGSKLSKAEPLKMNFYVTAHKVESKKVLSYFQGSYSKFRKLNPHININKIKTSKKLPAGVPIVLPKKLANSYFKLTVL